MWWSGDSHVTGQDVTFSIMVVSGLYTKVNKGAIFKNLFVDAKGSVKYI